MKRVIFLMIAGGLSAAILFSTGCEDRRRHQASEAVTLAKVEPPVPADAPPKDVARALLSALADAQRARAGGLGDHEKKKAYDRAFGQVCALAARKELYEQVISARSMTIPRDISKDAAVNVIVESWISSIAHYCDGINFDTLRIIPEAPQADAAAQVEAQNPREREILAQLEAELRQSPPIDAQGSAASPNSPAYLSALRAKTVTRGFNFPEGTGIELHMRKSDGGWHVTRVTLSSAVSRPKPTTAPATKLPTASAQPSANAMTTRRNSAAFLMGLL